MTTINIYDKAVELHYADVTFAGYGHEKITVEVAYNGEFKKFAAKTDFMPAVDAAKELEGDAYYEALYYCVDTDLDDIIYDWILDVEADA